MLTRRHIRVKVLQSLYAYQNQNNANLEKQEKFLVYSMEQMHDLYLLLLHLLTAIHTQAEGYMEKSKLKHLATSLEKSPNRNFIDNKILALLAENNPLNIQLKNKKITNWELDNEYPQILFKEIRQSELYADYLKLIHPTFQQDKAFIITLYSEIIAPNEKLYSYLEDHRLTWIDDFPIVNTAIVKMLNQLKPITKEDKLVPKLYKNDEDKDFAIALFNKTVLQDTNLLAEIEGKTPNWDKERIAELDLILIKMGITEFLYFPSIPVKVTINEYLEIAKEYSTPKSSLFINGILDKLVKEYMENNKLNKIGRGLQ
ncbi:MAG: antitermination protein NusB [Flavobacteriaceae bacterium CG_4_8_14_3_um_filter_34_10]|nr:transcription antitermination protein NusB [Flavobacteriia bacterium]OIP52720.1 MAG: antitermination protein NusB [Flavobacteriaceae bacterium CG2_30_34_30]PIQ19560.1 MAG: antitermination protein NusB [Flavobacteriaceae bacterium CG18_big_fil_WC_8_21_14_2_50_34_36]PIV48572.1 MAG: antitermination protein NusB [Flavobacteriaceae bacterium CG02_land_8_20_14_3_00_34_13]PIX09303.1 MAG: antitermination protein NusB [Flavobacteriaceae bacterium CG_4_8_14_3_um_filter_34_10]PIZ07377.1 MAG: antitermi